MAWILLTLAGLFEIGWAIGLKYTEGFTRPMPTVLTIVAMVISVVLLGLAVRTLPVGTAYAVWTGLGAVGVIIGGILFFGDRVNGVQIGFMALIVVGVVGTKFFASA